MANISFEELLDAGVHFGHLKRKWNPNMAPYIFMERNGIHIIDLYKTIAKLDEACSAVKQIAKSGKKILFVATKKQAKELVAQEVKRANMPYVVERWPGGMLTNFATVRKAVRKMASIDKLMNTKNFMNLSKRERLQITRERAKLEKQLGSIADLNRLPSALVIIDINKEHIAVAEAKKLNIPTVGVVDTNSDPTLVDFPVPANDDASKSISLLTRILVDAVEEGLKERKMERDKRKQEEEEEREEEEIRTKSKTVEEYEEQEDEEAEKSGKKTPEVKAGKKMKEDRGEGEKRPRRPRKTVSKKVNKK